MLRLQSGLLFDVVGLGFEQTSAVQHEIAASSPVASPPPEKKRQFRARGEGPVRALNRADCGVFQLNKPRFDRFLRHRKCLPGA